MASNQRYKVNQPNQFLDNIRTLSQKAGKLRKLQDERKRLLADVTETNPVRKATPPQTG